MIRSVLITLTILLAPCATFAQEIPTGKASSLGMSQKGIDAIGVGMKRFMAKKKLPGMVYVVAKDGKIVCFEAVGWKQWGKKAKLEKDAIFRMASMTKPITAVVLMDLWEEGKFKLNDPVGKHLKELKDLKVLENGKEVKPKRPMTVRDLLTHTGGLAYGYSLGKTPVDAAYTKANVLDPTSTFADMVTKLSKIPLAYHPGEKWVYSLSCDVQARLVEVLAGEPFDVVLKKRIFDPLDMMDTGYFVPKEKLHRLPSVHYGPGLVPSGKPEDSLQATKFLGGGHGLYSTARDYLRFAEMMRRGGKLGKVRVLEEKTARMMMANQIPEKLVPIAVGKSVLHGTGFGFGGSVQVRLGYNNAGEVGLWGWAGAMSTSFFISPKDDLVAIALAQVAPFSNEVMFEFEKLVLAARKTPARKSKAGAR